MTSLTHSAISNIFDLLQNIRILFRGKRGKRLTEAEHRQEMTGLCYLTLVAEHGNLVHTALLEICKSQNLETRLC